MNDLQKLTSVLVFMLVGMSVGTEAFAEDAMCDTYRKFFPSLYEISCHGSRSSVSRPSVGGGSSFASSFNLNSAAIPTTPSPYGLETITSVLRQSYPGIYPSFSLVKGFTRIGTGLSTASGNTFFGDDIVQRRYGTPLYSSFNPLEPAKSNLPNVALGTSFAVLQPQAKVGSGISLGVSLRYNHISDTLGFGLGFIYTYGLFHAGVGMSHERVSNYFDAINFLTAVVGVRLLIFDFEISQLRDDSLFQLDPIMIYSATATLGGLLLSASERSLNFYSTGTVTQEYFSAQYQISKHFTAAYLFNYVPGANSVAFQIFL